MGLMSRVLDLSKPSGPSSLLQRALVLRKKVVQSESRQSQLHQSDPSDSQRSVSAKPTTKAAASPSVVVLDDVKKKPFPKSWTMAA